jgi:hypothetical protein
MLRRRLLQALVTLVVAAVCSLVAAQPASADVVIPAGRSGSACSNYINVNANLFFQVCAWTSWTPPNSRIWFTEPFRVSA